MKVSHQRRRWRAHADGFARMFCSNIIGNILSPPLALLPPEMCSGFDVSLHHHVPDWAHILFQYLPGGDITSGRDAARCDVPLDVSEIL